MCKRVPDKTRCPKRTPPKESDDRVGLSQPRERVAPPWGGPLRSEPSDRSDWGKPPSAALGEPRDQTRARERMQASRSHQAESSEGSRRPNDRPAPRGRHPFPTNKSALPDKVNHCSLRQARLKGEPPVPGQQKRKTRPGQSRPKPDPVNHGRNPPRSITDEIAVSRSRYPVPFRSPRTHTPSPGNPRSAPASARVARSTRAVDGACPE